MLPLSDYAVASADATVHDALEALQLALSRLPPDRQPHRAVLVRSGRGEIIGKIHYFAFLRAMLPDPRPRENREVLERAGVSDDVRDSYRHMLDMLLGDLVDFGERARRTIVRDIYAPATINIQEDATIYDAILRFLNHQTLSLLVRRGDETVGILRLSDLFEEISRQVLQPAAVEGA
jgi:CBS domain containing-hemolysin-like protein